MQGGFPSLIVVVAQLRIFKSMLTSFLSSSFTTKNTNQRRTFASCFAFWGSKIDPPTFPNTEAPLCLHFCMLGAGLFHDNICFWTWTWSTIRSFFGHHELCCSFISSGSFSHHEGGTWMVTFSMATFGEFVWGSCTSSMDGRYICHHYEQSVDGGVYGHGQTSWISDARFVAWKRCGKGIAPSKHATRSHLWITSGHPRTWQHHCHSPSSNVATQPETCGCFRAGKLRGMVSFGCHCDFYCYWWCDMVSHLWIPLVSLHHSAMVYLLPLPL